MNELYYTDKVEREIRFQILKIDLRFSLHFSDKKKKLSIKEN